MSTRITRNYARYGRGDLNEIEGEVEYPAPNVEVPVKFWDVSVRYCNIYLLRTVNRHYNFDKFTLNHVDLEDMIARVQVYFLPID